MQKEPSEKLTELPMQLIDLRWITEVTPNGVSRDILQYRIANSGDWHDVKRTNVKRKLEWA